MDPKKAAVIKQKYLPLVSGKPLFEGGRIPVSDIVLMDGILKVFHQEISGTFPRRDYSLSLTTFLSINGIPYMEGDFE